MVVCAAKAGVGLGLLVAVAWGVGVLGGGVSVGAGLDVGSAVGVVVAVAALLVACGWAVGGTWFASPFITSAIATHKAKIKTPFCILDFRFWILNFTPLHINDRRSPYNYNPKI